MSKKTTKLSALRRKEIAQIKRNATKDVGKFVGIGPQPFHLGKPRLAREQARQAMLIAYAVAIAIKRGKFADETEASKWYATVSDMVSNADVRFTKGPGDLIWINVPNLDWSPEVATEQLAA